PSDDGPSVLVPWLRQRTGLLIALSEDWSDADLRVPSALPGWSRAHVLVHLGQVTSAMARQAEHALRGALVDVYDGGRPGRDAAIESGARGSGQEVRDTLATGLRRLLAVWERVSPQDWSRPVRYRDGDLAGTARAVWREVEIHLVDLDAGYRTSEWTAAFTDHLVEFMTWRLPEGVAVRLVPSDGGRTRSHGAGVPVTVTGTATDLAAWLAGRDAPSLRADRPEGPPALTPWN
uniref:maleylpyruvate isomerase family mycothiol-dependent enzyme n=1 Tax=Actinoalloteichus spitiensis TaxID=252394 RepID=UPI0003668D2B